MYPVNFILYGLQLLNKIYSNNYKFQNHCNLNITDILYVDTEGLLKSCLSSIYIIRLSSYILSIVWILYLCR